MNNRDVLVRQKKEIF